MRRFLGSLLILVSFAGGTAEARSRYRGPTPPLMPPPASREDAVGVGRPNLRQIGTASETMIIEAQDEKASRRNWMFGAEMGSLGYSTGANADAFGLNLLWGGRIIGRAPISYHWFFKPTLGFFYRRDGTAGAGVSQNIVEAGIAPQYVINPEDQVRCAVSLVNHVDLLWGRITALGASASQPLDWRYRLGPGVGGIVSATRSLQITFDAEMTRVVTGTGKFLGGISAGAIFRFD